MFSSTVLYGSRKLQAFRGDENYRTKPNQLRAGSLSGNFREKSCEKATEHISPQTENKLSKSQIDS